uniref:Uncharacterized protein n=1 Tax=viral metagenome TaxID=1070528 RepID=A0A6C0JA60_9ZZZZ|tara:strand:+ start:305 stop:862 length:558 start_codon:yes stop_codon:yes gene_type:complete
MTTLITQNSLLLTKLLEFYNKDGNMERILPIINGESLVSLRLIDWFATNYSKKNYTVYPLTMKNGDEKRFKVYIDYKLKLKAYSKKRFDPFCRWDRITIPYKEDTYIQTTIGQLNFFRWALENKILDCIEKNLTKINNDMNNRNSTAKNRKDIKTIKTRKKREELSISASKSIKKEQVEIIVEFK